MSVSGFSDASADLSVGPTSVREDTIRMLPRRIGDRRRHDFVQPVPRKTKGQLARTICAQPDGTDRVWVAVSPVIEYKIESPSIARPASKDCCLNTNHFLGRRSRPALGSSCSINALW
jgi:hypothetical protein